MCDSNVLEKRKVMRRITCHSNYDLQEAVHKLWNHQQKYSILHWL